MSTHARDLALTGLPRGGTTLACKLLARSPDCVALVEPIEPPALPADPEAAGERVASYYREWRQSLLRDGTAPSMLRDGAIPDNPFAPAAADGIRRTTVARGMLRMVPPPQPGFLLAIKHNAMFTALLQRLAARMRVLAIVRNPLAVLASWNTLGLPVRQGRIPAGERLDPALGACLDRTADTRERQLLVLDWFLARYRQADAAVTVLRYEDIVGSGGTVLFESAGVASPADSRLQPRNASAAYAGVDIDDLCSRLLARDGQWRNWYAEHEVADLARRLREAGA